MRVVNGKIIASEQDICNAIIITQTLAQFLHESADIKGLSSDEIDIFQKFYYAVNDGRFGRAVDKAIEAHKKNKRK